MFPSPRDTFFAALSCLKNSPTKPSHFNSSCGHIVQQFQSWNPHPSNEVKSEDDSEIVMSESGSNEEVKTNSVKLQQGYTNSGTLSHMVCVKFI